MKIVLDVSQAIYGTGVSDYTIELANGLHSHTPGLTLFGSSLRRRNEFKNIFPGVNLITSWLPPSLTNILWNQLHILPIESFTGQAGIYHSSDWAQAPSHAKKVTTIHDLSPFLFPDEMASGGMTDVVKTHQARMKWVARECDKIICVSENTKKDLVKIFPAIEESRVVVIPEALPSRFQKKALTGEIKIIKQKFGLESYIVAIGTLQPRKNIVRLVNSFLTYRKKFNLPEKIVVIGGKGWGDSPIPHDPSVLYTGYVPDHELISLLGGAAVFAYPSLYEGFGLPILIAFNQGIPVVTSDISSLPEIAGRGAILVDPVSEVSIAQGLAQALKNGKKLVSEGSKQLSRYSWQKTISETLKVYKSLAI